MNKRSFSIIVIIIVLGGIAGLLFMKSPAKAPSKTSTPSSTTETQKSTESDVTPVSTNKIDIKNFAFSPAVVTVKKGTTITWTNQDDTRHSISPDTETTDFKPSQLLSKGETYSVTFTSAGTYTYHCTPHPYMKASVIVTE